MSDEARHVAFGVLTLSEFYGDLSEAELKERQEFLVDATLNSTVPGHHARGVGAHGHDRRGRSAPSSWRRRRRRSSTRCGGFARGFFAKLVPNVRKLGLLDANDGYLREKWGEAGLLEFEFADDTGSDYESYDAVARDRRRHRHVRPGTGGLSGFQAPAPSDSPLGGVRGRRPGRQRAGSAT